MHMQVYISEKAMIDYYDKFCNQLLKTLRKHCNFRPCTMFLPTLNSHRILTYWCNLKHILHVCTSKANTIFIAVKIDNFQMKNCDICHIFAQNIDCCHSLEPPQSMFQSNASIYVSEQRLNLCFRAK